VTLCAKSDDLTKMGKTKMPSSEKILPVILDPPYN
jgi:hypothetical protein